MNPRAERGANEIAMTSWWRGGGGFLRRAVESRRASACSYHTIQAVPREYTGSRIAAKERAEGKIPTVVFTPGDDGGSAVTHKQLLTTYSQQIGILLNKEPFFCSTVFRLRVRAGPGSTVVLNSGYVLPIKVHKKEETGQILNLVMAWAEKGAELKVDVPVVFKGENVCPGLTKGGYLHKIRSSLKYLCPAEHIPPKIEVDLTNLDIGDRIFMHDIEVHPSLKLLSKNETMPVCKILAVTPAAPEPKVISASTETSKVTED